MASCPSPSANGGPSCFGADREISLTIAAVFSGWLMRAAAEMRLGRIPWPTRGMNVSYRTGAPATSVGRVVSVSAAWGMPRNARHWARKGAGSIFRIMKVEVGAIGLDAGVEEGARLGPRHGSG